MKISVALVFAVNTLILLSSSANAVRDKVRGTMKLKRPVFSLVAFGLGPFAVMPAAAGNFNDRQVDYIFAGDTRPCIFFRLVGINEADPLIPGSAWFVLPKTHPLFRESYALLLSAKLAGRAVSITTTGAIDPCGHAQVLVVGVP